jgi:hypothetical protein
MSIYSKPVRFTDAEAKSDAFERLLKELGIKIEPKGALEQICLYVKELADFHLGKAKPSASVDFRPHLRTLMGLDHLVSLALALGVEKLRPFKDHLALLNEGTPLQNVAAPRNDPSGDKLFELLIALGAVRMGAEVTVDSPDRSKGDNPDVIAAWKGARWGFACKVPSGDSPTTLFDRIAEGVEQIEKSPSEHGFVVLNFKNRLDHDGAFPILSRGPGGEPTFGPLREPDSVIAELRAFADARTKAMVEQATREEVEKLFANRKALPALLVWLQTAIPQRLPKEVAPPGLEGAAVIGSAAVLHPISLEWTKDRLDAGVDALFSSLYQGLRLD